MSPIAGTQITALFGTDGKVTGTDSCNNYTRAVHGQWQQPAGRRTSADRHGVSGRRHDAGADLPGRAAAFVPIRGGWQPVDDIRQYRHKAVTIRNTVGIRRPSVLLFSEGIHIARMTVQQSVLHRTIHFQREEFNMATKSKKVAVTKSELEETAVGVEALAESRMEDGLIEVSAGAQTLVASRKVRQVARAAQTAGAVAVTHGVDQMAVAEKLGRLSEVVAAAGELDVAEGIEALATSEDIQIQSALVSSFSMAALARAMELAAVAGQLHVAADIVSAREMPVLAAFLEDKGNLLRVFAVDTVKRAGAGRVLAQAMAETGEKVGDMGANEVAEGLIRMAVAEEGAERSADLFADGAMNAVAGVEALAAAAGARQVARRSGEGRHQAGRCGHRGGRPGRGDERRGWGVGRSGALTLLLSCTSGLGSILFCFRDNARDLTGLLIRLDTPWAPVRSSNRS